MTTFSSLETICPILMLSAVFLSTAAAPVMKTSSPAVLPTKESFHLFLLVGQSNMAGRGKVEDEDKVPHPRVLTLNKAGQWVPAADPIHFDKPGRAGVCLARTFGMVLADKSEKITIGLIPCAHGGSPISAWEPGAAFPQTQSHPYDDSIARAREAMKSGVLKGILWHQGEGDCKPELAALYQEKLTQLIARFRQDLEAPQVPFILGQLGQFSGAPWNPDRQKVNDAQTGVTREVLFTRFVSSAGLMCNSTNDMHFDGKSLREFGRRYAEAYFSLTKSERSPPLP